MSKVEFSAPRFCGDRFDEHTLPLEMAEDLVAYQDLVVKLAKHLFIEKNPDRQRVPKGFGKDFQLHIERIDEGSAQPVLALIAAASLGLGDGENHYFEQARDLVTECIAAEGCALPEAFPQDLLAQFNKLGRSLREGESIEFLAHDGRAEVCGRLTQQRRKDLVLAASQVYEREVELEGTMGEADWEKSTFRLRLDDDSSVVIPMDQKFHQDARRCGGKSRHRVRVRGVASYDSYEKLQKITSVEEIEPAWNYDIAVKFEELLSLQDGWYDGQGKALPPDATEKVAIRFIANHPDPLPLPAIVPTPEGNLLVEWNSGGDPSLDIDLVSLKGEFHMLRHFQPDLEEEFDLSDEKEWTRFFTFLEQNVA